VLITSWTKSDVADSDSKSECSRNTYHKDKEVERRQT